MRFRVWGAQSRHYVPTSPSAALDLKDCKDSKNLDMGAMPEASKPN